MLNKKSYRETIGEQLKMFRELRGITKYRVAKNGGIYISQVTEVEKGEMNYTIDVFIGYIIGCGLYMYFASKNSDNNKHDFKEMIEKLIKEEPKI